LTPQVDLKQLQLSPTLGEFVSRLGTTSPPTRYTATQDGQVYGQVFHLFTYACLADAPAAEAEGDRSPNGPDLFASPVQRALYELATCTDTGDPNYRPHPAYLSRLWDRGLVALWDNWQALALHDNVVFLGVRDTRFLATDFPHNVENDYF